MRHVAAGPGREPRRGGTSRPDRVATTVGASRARTASRALVRRVRVPSSAAPGRSGGEARRPEPMTLLWESSHDGTRYSVRSHGASVRLYSNGVFHSQWNPERPFAGGVWDCLALPALYREPAHIRHVLVLGVGGGAVIRQLESLIAFESLTGVEIDAVHLDVARRWFGVEDVAVRSSSKVTLVEADAVAWLQDRAGEPFDLVIDDLFGHRDGEPVRARPLTPDWVSLLRRSVDDAGLVVVNGVDGRELKAAASVFADEGFRHARRWSQAGYENAVGVFAAAPLVPREWSRRLERSALPAPMQKRARGIVRRPLRMDQKL